MKRDIAILAVGLLVAAACCLLGGPSAVIGGYETGVYMTDGGDRLVVSSSGTLQVDGGANLLNAVGVGAAGVTSTGLSLVERGDGVLHQTVFTLDDFELAITDHTTAGAHSSAKLYDFPAGYIKFVGTSADLDVECGTAGLTTTATYAVGIGTATTGVDNAVLATTEQDILSVVTGDLTASAAALGTALATDASKDGHTTAAGAYLNLLFAADDASAADVCTVTGTVTVHWVNLGDY